VHKELKPRILETTLDDARLPLPDLVADVDDHGHLNGLWKYRLSEFHYLPAVDTIAAAEQANVAAHVARYRGHSATSSAAKSSSQERSARRWGVFFS
jgi:hypothetical protein